MPGIKGTSIEQAASNVAADKKMRMRRAMVNSIFYCWLKLTFFRPAIGFRGLIARISRLVDGQLPHGRAF